MDILNSFSLRSLDSRGFRDDAGKFLLSSTCVKRCGFKLKSDFCSSIATESFVVDLHVILSLEHLSILIQMSYVSFVGKQQRCSDKRRHPFY